jgi:PRC-barrel domain
VTPKRERRTLMTQMHTEVWGYRDTTLESDLSGSNVVGYNVEALDGSIGKVDEATFDATAGYIVVDTGPWIFGKKVLLPAGVINSADHNDEKVFVNRTKDQIKNAPEFDDSLTRDETYRGQLGSYYSRGGAGFRDWD